MKFSKKEIESYISQRPHFNSETCNKLSALLYDYFYEYINEIVIDTKSRKVTKKEKEKRANRLKDTITKCENILTTYIEDISEEMTEDELVEHTAQIQRSINHILGQIKHNMTKIHVDPDYYETSKKKKV